MLLLHIAMRAAARRGPDFVTARHGPSCELRLSLSGCASSEGAGGTGQGQGALRRAGRRSNRLTGPLSRRPESCRCSSGAAVAAAAAAVQQSGGGGCEEGQGEGEAAAVHAEGDGESCDSRFCGAGHALPA